MEIKAETNIYDVFTTVFHESIRQNAGMGKSFEGGIIKNAILDAQGAVNALEATLQIHHVYREVKE